MNKSELIDLVEQMKNGSRDAFKELYEEYYDRLYFFVLKNVGNKEAAEDITQDTFMRSMEKIGTLENPENYVTWLHTIAYHKCTDMFRSKRHDAYFDTEEEFENAMENHSLNEPIMVPEDYATDKDRARQLKEMIDSLKPDMKSVLILYYYNDMSLADVAKTMGLTENNVKQKLFRARKKLKDKIDAMGGKGIMFAAVPMDELLHRTVSPKQAAAVAGKSGAVTTVGSGLAAGKIAGISAAAIMAVGIPLALGNIGKDKDIKGNIQLHDSSAVITSAYDSTASSSAESALEDIITSSLSDSSVSDNDTSSRPEETKAPDASSEPSENYAAPGFNATAAVSTSSQAETTAQTNSDPSEAQTDSSAVDVTVINQDVDNAIEILNNIEYFNAGYDIRWSDGVYDENFELCNDPETGRYYHLPNYNAEEQERRKSILYSDYLTDNFRTSRYYYNYSGEENAIGYRADNAIVEHNGEYYYDNRCMGTGNYGIYERTDNKVNIIDDNTCTVNVREKDGMNISGEGINTIITLKKTADGQSWQIDSIG